MFIVFLPIKLRLSGKYSRMLVNIHHVIQSEAKNDNLVSMVKKPSKNGQNLDKKRQIQPILLQRFVKYRAKCR